MAKVTVNTAPPTLAAGAVNRSSDTNATVTFTSDEAGTAYYQIDGTAPTAAELVGCAPSTNGSMVSSENTISLTSLTAGAHTIYIAAKDAAGKISNLLTINIPAYTPANHTVTQHFGTFTGSGTRSATVDAEHVDFLRLEKDGAVVDPGHYTTREGSTIITLAESHLKTQPNGTHTYRAVFTGGYPYGVYIR